MCFGGFWHNDWPPLFSVFPYLPAGQGLLSLFLIDRGCFLFISQTGVALSLVCLAAQYAKRCFDKEFFGACALERAMSTLVSMSLQCIILWIIPAQAAQYAKMYLEQVSRGACALVREMCSETASLGLIPGPALNGAFSSLLYQYLQASTLHP